MEQNLNEFLLIIRVYLWFNVSMAAMKRVHDLSKVSLNIVPHVKTFFELELDCSNDLLHICWFSYMV